MFFERSASRGVTSTSFSAPTVSDVSGTAWTLVLVERAVLERVLRVAGLLEVPVGERVGVDDQRAALRQVAMFVLSAAGFIATRTFGSSPGVRMSWSEKWIWKPETPGSEPAGARISAGKSGSVEMSLPSTAVSVVNGRR